MLLGIGMGGFVDGILFHQILQTHNMLSAKVLKTTIVNVEVNMFWDGLFHAFTWVMTALGICFLFRAGRRAEVPWSGRILGGGLLLGWGLFNLVEGIIDHHILNLHHVIERLGVSAWDWGFLAVGAVFLIVGWLMVARAPTETPGRGDVVAGV
jgi:uncharacterized membrane protein